MILIIKREHPPEHPVVHRIVQSSTYLREKICTDIKSEVILTQGSQGKHRIFN